MNDLETSENRKHKLLSYSDVLAYNRFMINPNGGNVDYDLVGVSRLFLAVLNNLQQNFVENDLEVICSCFSMEKGIFHSHR